MEPKLKTVLIKVVVYDDQEPIDVLRGLAQIARTGQMENLSTAEENALSSIVSMSISGIKAGSTA